MGNPYRFLLRRLQDRRAALTSAAEVPDHRLRSDVDQRVESARAGAHALRPFKGRSMRGRSWRLSRIMVVVAFIAAAALLVGTFTATRSASHAPFVFTKGDPDSSIKTKAGILIIFPEILVAIFIIKTANTKIGNSYASFFYKTFSSLNWKCFRVLND